MSYRSTPECDKYAIPFTTSTGKTFRVVPYETALRFEQERNEVQEKYDTLAVENMLEVNKICKQRDAAMDVLSDISRLLNCELCDENTTAKEYGARIRVKYEIEELTNMMQFHKLCNQRDAAIDTLMKIEDIFIDGDDTYEDRKSMGQIARTFFEKTYESRINKNN
jgi:glutaredoxin-related protein